MFDLFTSNKDDFSTPNQSNSIIAILIGLIVGRRP